MDIATLVNIGVIGIFFFVVILIYVNLRAQKKHLASDSRDEQAFRKWLIDNNYSPDHTHFFRGTGIAIKNGENRLALIRQGQAGFQDGLTFAELTSSEEVVGRMVGAAPGVVRQVNTTLYVLEMKPKHSGNPAFRLTFQDPEQRLSWATRLHELIAGKS